ncbi:MAG: ATP-binding protein, partial [Sandaracinaceae bacterium]
GAFVEAGWAEGGLPFAPALSVLRPTWCVVGRAPEAPFLMVVGYDARTVRFVDHDLGETLTYVRMSALNLEALSAQLRAHADLERERQQLVTLNAELGRRDRELSQKNEALGQALTELRRTQQELVHTERLSAVGQLAAGIAHEVNNPATYVASNLEELSEMVGQGQLSDWEGRPLKLLQEASSGLEHIVGIIRELGRFSRADRKENDVFLVAEMVESVRRLASNQVALVAKLETQAADGLAVRGSRRELTQVLLNLVINAAQAMPKGQPPEANRVSIRGFGRDGQVVIAVEDTGRGIPDDVVEAIFQPFFTTKQNAGGTGLGLSIAVEIAHRHGGSLTIASTGPEGTCFELALPCVAPAELKVFHSTHPPHAVKARVLLVDDDARILRAHSRKLASHLDVVTALGPLAALELLRSGEEFDAILADLMMPEMNGLELWRTVTRERPQYRGRFFFVSGGIARQDLRREIAELSIPVVPKPIRATDVRELIEGLGRGAIDAFPLPRT